MWNSKECVPLDSECFFLFMNVFTKLWSAFCTWKTSFEVSKNAFSFVFFMNIFHWVAWENVTEWSGNDKKRSWEKRITTLSSDLQCVCAEICNMLYIVRKRAKRSSILVFAPKNKTNFGILVYCSATFSSICPVLKLQNLCKFTKTSCSEHEYSLWRSF